MSTNPLDGSPLLEASCKFMLNGKNYRWREPVIIQAKRQWAAMMRLSAKAHRSTCEQAAATSEEERLSLKMAYSNECVADILDFLAEFHDEIRQDMKDITARMNTGEVTDTEIVVAYTAIRDFVIRPLEGKRSTMVDHSNGNGSPSTESTSSVPTTLAAMCAYMVWWLPRSRVRAAPLSLSSGSK